MKKASIDRVVQLGIVRMPTAAFSRALLVTSSSLVLVDREDSF
jgi:hypothetical protein